MHDLDRALQEFESADTELQSESYEFEEETDAESDYEGESDGETNGNGETDGSYETEYELSQESGRQGDYEAVFDELEEMEQAAALLEVQDEGELEQFLGGLIGKVAKKLGAFVPADLRKALGDTLRKVARSALPKAGAILGNLVAPGVGGVIGNQVAAGASKMFGLELEGLSYEDQEFEVARRVVGLSAEATKAMSQAAPTAAGQSASQIANDAVLRAAQTHAPGLATAVLSAAPFVGPVYRGAARRTGRWYRRGHRIILVGL